MFYLYLSNVTVERIEESTKVEMFYLYLSAMTQYDVFNLQK